MRFNDKTCVLLNRDARDKKNDNPKVLGGVVKLVLLRSVCRIFLKINMQPSFIVACQQPTIFRPCGFKLCT